MIERDLFLSSRFLNTPPPTAKIDSLPKHHLTDGFAQFIVTDERLACRL